MTRTFHAPASYHPSDSLLGRALRTWTGDRLQGEALFIVVLTGLALVLLLTHYLGWALLNMISAATPAEQRLFWMGQAAVLLVLSGIGLVGFRPAVMVTCSPQGLHFSQGDQTLLIAPDEIERVDTVSAQRYHRHYRRYAATHIFISKLPGEVILLRTARGPIVTALPEADAQAALLTRMKALRTDEEERRLAPLKS